MSWITQQLGDSCNSQEVNAYRASIALSLEVPGCRLIMILAVREVLSSTRLILILPLSLAFIMVSMRVSVVSPNGISVIARVLLSIF